MKEKVYIDRLFTDYEDSPALKDFKEEITANLKERVGELIKKGMDEEQAFDAATSELGDITAIADEVGRRKRGEAIGRMYTSAKTPPTKLAAAGFAAATGLLILGIVTTVNRYISPGGEAEAVITAGRVFDIPFLLFALSCGMFMFFGLSTETSSRYAMGRGRAFAYAVLSVPAAWALIVSVLLVTGACALEGSAAVIITTLALPSVCGFIYLLATQKDRRKPWRKAWDDKLEAITNEHVRQSFENALERKITTGSSMVNPAKAAKYGVLSGGLWVLAIAVFCILHFAAQLPYAWITFLLAAAAQVFMTSMIFDTGKK